MDKEVKKKLEAIGADGVLVSPIGTAIEGTLEKLQGTALIGGFTYENGKVEIDAAGETTIHWDTQETVHEEGEPVFRDRNSNEFRWSELFIAPENKTNKRNKKRHWVSCAGLPYQLP